MSLIDFEIKKLNTNLSNQTDLFGRNRVSNPTTLFDFHNVNDINSITFDNFIINGATITHSNDSYKELTVSSTNNSKAIRQSYEYVPYQPGKSKLIFLTGLLNVDGGVTGIVSRIGIFDDENEKNLSLDTGGNGLFFELNGKNLYVCERHSDNASGQYDNKIIQSSWNIDTMGAGPLNPSNIKINDFSKAYIFVIDLEWLGVGISRFGFVVDGHVHYVHRFLHRKITKPYIRYAKLPVRFDIKNVSATTSSSMRIICGSIISEGGYNIRGRQFSVGTNTVARTVPTTKFLPIITLKLSNDHIRNTIYLKNVDFLISSTSNKPIHYQIIHNGTVLGGSYLDVNNSSFAKYNISGTTITDGYVMKGGYVENKGSRTLFSGLDDMLQSSPICANITGESQNISIVAKAIGSSADVYCNLEWIEII